MRSKLVNSLALRNEFTNSFALGTRQPKTPFFLSLISNFVTDSSGAVLHECKSFSKIK
jgi:hypothetical protein